jgi:XTP/dITP diphosphohydrolase
MLLYVATSNLGKLRDFAVAAEDLGIGIGVLPGLRDIPAPAENESTFGGNARAKAVYYSRFLPGELVMADDSGLEVDALGGKPGVRSARFAEDAGYLLHSSAGADEKNNLYLLSRLENVPETGRGARYRCVLAAARNGVVVLTGEGAVEGRILREPRGEGGFGYDPLFYQPAFGKTMAEIDLATKHKISHRGRALRTLLLSMRSAALS